MKYVRYIGLLIAVVLIASCGGTGSGGGGGGGVGDAGGTSTVTIVIGSTQGAGIITESDSLYAFIEEVMSVIGPSEVSAQIPDNVYRVIITIAGGNFSVRDEFIVTSSTDTITRQYTVPNRVPLIFRAVTFDANQTTPSWESASNPQPITITGPRTVTIDLFPFEEEIMASVFVSNFNDHSVSAFDPLSFGVLPPLDCSGLPGPPECVNPRHLAVSHDGLIVGIPFSGSDNLGGIANIPPSPPVFAGVLDLDTGTSPHAIVARCDDEEAWVVNPGNDSVDVVTDIVDNVIDTITSDSNCSFNSPSAIALAGPNAYIANGNGTVCVVEIAPPNRNILRTIDTGTGGAFTPEYAEATTNGAYVFISYGDFVVRITTDDDRLDFYSVPAHQLALSPDGLKIYAAAGGCIVQEIDVFSGSNRPIRFDDLNTSACVAESLIGVEVLEMEDGTYRGFASDFDQNRIYVFDADNRVPVRDANTGELISFAVGDGPISIASQPTQVTPCGPFDGGQEPGECYVTEGQLDAGELPDTARLAGGDFGSTLLAISGNLTDSNDADMYEIIIDDPANFSASTVSGDGVGSVNFDSMLFLFQSESVDRGMGIIGNDDVGDCSDPTDPGCASRLDDGESIDGPGRYFVVITSFANHPTSTAGQIFNTIKSSAQNVGPNGPGGGSPISGYDDGGASSGSYSINFTGAQCID